MTIWRCVACWIIKATRAQAHARASATPPPAHTHTEICNSAYPLQQCFANASHCYIIHALPELLSKYFDFAVSVSFHCCSILTFIYTVIRTSGRSLRTFEKQRSFRISGRTFLLFQVHTGIICHCGCRGENTTHSECWYYVHAAWNGSSLGNVTGTKL
jgi:hypothetical protein